MIAGFKNYASPCSFDNIRAEQAEILRLERLSVRRSRQTHNRLVFARHTRVVDLKLNVFAIKS